MQRQRLGDEDAAGRGVDTGEPEKQDARGRPLLSVDKLAEVLVTGDQQPTLLLRDGQDFLVTDTGRQFRDVHHIVAASPQRQDNGPIDVLIRETSHAQEGRVDSTSSLFIRDAANCRAARMDSGVKRGCA